ncbi:MAG TPA: monovalent cation/H(+) antiporter subunit G [Lysobacter sp.]|nr:monovalent cation/H(+) antiporter subunit G [Lysobacter sp.]
MSAVPAWAQALAAVLLAASGLLVLLAAGGFLRLPHFFLRMHPPALTYTLASWCVAGAGVVLFSGLEGRPVLHTLLVPALLAVTVPVTTVLLARSALFRQRQAGRADAPAPLPSTGGAGAGMRAEAAEARETSGSPELPGLPEQPEQTRLTERAEQPQRTERTEQAEPPQQARPPEHARDQARDLAPDPRGQAD